MAWTAPRTWVAGEKPSAATMNLHIRDNELFLYDGVADQVWTAYSASWTASGTNPAIGNGTITSKYAARGLIVQFYCQILMGSTTTYGTGSWLLNFPPAAETARTWSFQGVARDSSAGTGYQLVAIRTGAGVLNLDCDATTAGAAVRAVTPTIPFTWAVGDQFVINGTYEAA